MANSALHAIAIAELRITAPAFHREYELLVAEITNLIRELAKKHVEILAYSSFTETYDRASREPILQIVIGTEQDEFHLHIYISQTHQFIIGQSGSGAPANNAIDALGHIRAAIQKVGWL